MKTLFSLLNNQGIVDAEQMVDLIVRAAKFVVHSVWVHDYVFNVGPVFDHIGGRP